MCAHLQSLGNAHGEEKKKTVKVMKKGFPPRLGWVVKIKFLQEPTFETRNLYTFLLDGASG